MKPLICLFLMLPALLRAQMITVPMTGVGDASGNPLAHGTICFAPVNNQQVPITFRRGGGGLAVSTPACVPVTNGQASIPLADTSKTSPLHVCFSATVTDSSTGDNVTPNGLTCVQPSSDLTDATAASWCTTTGSVTTCNLDNYTPNQPSLAVVQKGQKGDKGDPGSPGAQGTAGCVVGSNCTNYTGNLVLAPYGTHIWHVGESNASGFGSGGSWSKFMLGVGYFKGRVAQYTNLGTLGATGPDILNQFNNSGPKADCLAHRSDGVPVWVIVEIGNNGGRSAAQVVSDNEAVWSAARAAGCGKVIATTFPDSVNPNGATDYLNQVNSAIRRDFLDTDSNGNITGTAGSKYDVLVDIYALVRYDGCTGNGQVCFTPNAYGGFNDGGHISPLGASIVAQGAVCAIALGASCAFNTQMQQWSLAPAYGTVSSYGNYTGPVQGHDWIINDLGSTGNMQIGFNASGYPSGSNYIFQNSNSGASGNGVANLSLLNGFNGTFQETGTNTAPYLYPGETRMYRYDQAGSGTAGTFYKIGSLWRTPPWSFDSGRFGASAFCVATAPNFFVPAYCDFYDTAGYSGTLGFGQNGPSYYQQTLGHRIQIANSSSSASSNLYAGSSSINSGQNDGGGVTVPPNGGALATVVSIYATNHPQYSVQVLGGSGSSVPGPKGDTGATGAPGALVLLESHTASAVASLDFTSFYSASYDQYKIEAVGIVSSSGSGSFVMQCSSNGGTSFDTTAANYSTNVFGINSSNGSGVNYTTSDPGVRIFGYGSGNTGTGATPLYESIDLYGLAAGLSKRVQGHGEPSTFVVSMMGQYSPTTSTNALRFTSVGGTFSGTIRIYGLAH